MKDLTVEIVRFVQEHQPPVVEAQFCDSIGRLHTFVDKSAIFTTDWGLEASSQYPQPGVIRCDELARYQSQDGQAVIRVRTEVESTEGLSEFIVLASQFSAWRVSRRYYANYRLVQLIFGDFQVCELEGECHPKFTDRACTGRPTINDMVFSVLHPLDDPFSTVASRRFFVAR
jgi:hypothetical protein